jgi:(2Fe-2S) ferredoxin
MSGLPLFFETRAHLLLCTGPSCRRAGSAQLFARATADLETDGLAYYTSGGSLRFTESGCLGACSSGPTVAAYYAVGATLAQAWYTGMDREKLRALAQALHDGAALPLEGRFDR